MSFATRADGNALHARQMVAWRHQTPTSTKNEPRRDSQPGSRAHGR